MRLVFLFTNQGSVPEGADAPWDPKVETKNFYAVNPTNGLPSEGYLYMLKAMLKEKIVDDLIIFIESNRWPGYYIYDPNIHCYVVPQVAHIIPFLQEGDVIFARGGFKSWFNFLTQMSEEKRWLLLYAANTGRERWKFWDICFDDLSGKHRYDIRNRFFYDFKKPINAEVFKPLNIKKEFDVCIGASHVSDRKAQWKTVEVVVAYKELFGEALKCVLPGRITHGVNSNKMSEKIKRAQIDVLQPGMVTRDKVCEYMNKSHIFVYLGQGGQNDRGPLESLQCGTPVMIASTRRHSPVVYGDSRYCTVAKDPEDFKGIAYQLKEQLDRYRHQSDIRDECHDYFGRVSGIDVILSDMRRLFDLIRNNPVPNIEILKKEYGV